MFKEASTGASNDLERVTDLARRMVTEFGMSALLGPVRYANPASLYLQSASSSRSDLSPETAAAVDSEIRAFINEAQEQALAVLTGHEKVLHELAKFLQDKEVISGDEIVAAVKRIEDIDIVPYCPQRESYLK